jgi:hypothetical protein
MCLASSDVTIVCSDVIRGLEKRKATWKGLKVKIIFYTPVNTVTIEKTCCTFHKFVFRGSEIRIG